MHPRFHYRGLCYGVIIEEEPVNQSRGVDRYGCADPLGKNLHAESPGRSELVPSAP